MAKEFETVGYSISKAIDERSYLATLRPQIRDLEMKLFAEWPKQYNLLWSSQQHADKTTLKWKNTRILKRMAVRLRSLPQLQDVVLKCAATVEERIAPVQMGLDIPSLDLKADLGVDLLADILKTFKI
jgi:hypothetical protein